MRSLFLVPSRYFIVYCCVPWYMFLAWLHRGGLDVIVICTNQSADPKIYNRARIGAQQMQNKRLHHITRLALLPAQHTQVDFPMDVIRSQCADKTRPSTLYATVFNA